jgi:hypothetical protein
MRAEVPDTRIAPAPRENYLRHFSNRARVVRHLSRAAGRGPGAAAY